MPAIQYGKSAYIRSRGNMPALPVINMFAESSPVDKQQIVMQSRKGLVSAYTVGSGPIRAIFQRDGVISGARITVSGQSVYSGTTLIGSIAGDGPVSVAGDNDEVLIAAGGILHRTDGATVTAVPFPDGASVDAITYLAGYFLALRADTQRWYFSAVGIGLTWAALDYASAENKPDKALDIAVLNDALVFFGTETVEFWARTGNADLPFSPIEGRVFEIGVKATGCVVSVDNSFFWIGSDNIIYRNGDVPIAISDDGMSERISASSTHSAYLVIDGRHKFVCFRIDDETIAYDVTTQQTCEFQSYGRSNFRVACSDGQYLGDDETGTVWTMTGYSDAGTVLERRLRGGFPIDGGMVPVNNVRVRCEVGGTTYLSGDYAPAEIEMRYSDDYGQTWSSWEAESLGEQGEYRTMPEWRALGIAAYPGRLFEWRVTDPVGFRFSGATINEKHGGLAR